MSSQESTVYQAFSDAKHSLEIQEGKRDSHIKICDVPKQNGLIPNCCADLHILAQKEKDKFDEARKNMIN
jgi:hypothetical protein